MPWSIFTDGGGQGVAGTWAEDLLKEIGAPLSAGNKQFVYDWEVSEGGGGKYNPLNQGPVPGHGELTSTGPQYGGGAADYVSWQAGLTGSKDYLGMGNFKSIEADLKSNQPAAARTALYNSPWASSHYGYGSSFSNAPFPGKTQALPSSTTQTQQSTGSKSGTGNISFWQAILGGPQGIAQYAANNVAGSGGVGVLANIYNLLSNPVDMLERGALILFGGIIVIVGLVILASGTKAGGAITGAATRGASTRISGAVSGSSADKQRRLALSEEANKIGERKMALKEKREQRLAVRSNVNAPATGKHRKTQPEAIGKHRKPEGVAA